MPEPTPAPSLTVLHSAAERCLEAHTRILESIALDMSPMWAMDPRDLGIGDSPNFLPGPPATTAGLTWLLRQGRGEYIPAFLTESQLSLFRRRIRSLVINSEIGLNVINCHQSYGVGTGFKYEVSARRKEGEQQVERVQAWVDAFVDHNELPLREGEAMNRVLTDGEWFWRVFPGAHGLMSVRIIEPEYVYSPTGDNGADSFGVRTDYDDVEDVKGYMVVHGPLADGAQPTFVDAGEILHGKHWETPCTSKRGFSPFYPVEPNLRAVEDLVQSAVSSIKARGKIAWIETFENATSDIIQTLTANQAALTGTDPITQQAVNIERYGYGTILRRPATTKIDFPAVNAGATDEQTVLTMALRIVAARFSMPEYMLTADASNANYSSTLVAESPFVKYMTKVQDFFARLLAGNRWPGPRQSLIWRQIRHLVEMGELPQSIYRDVDIQATGPSLVVRDQGTEATTNKTYLDMQVKSRATIQAELGLDSDEQAANFAKEKQSQAGQPQTQTAGAQPPGGQPPTGTATAAPGDAQDPGSVRASVGGLQAILSLQQSVYDGTVPREAAIANAVLVFGFEQSQAEKLFPEIKPQKTADDGQQAGPNAGAGPAGLPAGDGATPSSAAGEQGAEQPPEDPFAGLGEAHVDGTGERLTEATRRDKRGNVRCYDDSTGRQVKCSPDEVKGARGKAHTAQQVHDKVRDVQAAGLKAEGVVEVAKLMAGLRVDELRKLNLSLGTRAGSARTHAALKERILKAALNVTPQAGPPAGLAGRGAKPPEPQPEPPQKAPTPTEAMVQWARKGRWAGKKLDPNKIAAAAKASADAGHKTWQFIEKFGKLGTLDDAATTILTAYYDEVLKGAKPAEKPPEAKPEPAKAPPVAPKPAAQPAPKAAPQSAAKMVEGLVAAWKSNPDPAFRDGIERALANAGVQVGGPGFTGTDALGREWLNGELVAAKEEPKKAQPAAASQQQKMKPIDPGEHGEVIRKQAEANRDTVVQSIRDYVATDRGARYADKASAAIDAAGEITDPNFWAFQAKGWDGLVAINRLQGRRAQPAAAAKPAEQPKAEPAAAQKPASKAPRLSGPEGYRKVESIPPPTLTGEAAEKHIRELTAKGLESLPEAQRKDYAESFSQTTGRMPRMARDRLASNLSAVIFAADKDSLRESMAEAAVEDFYEDRATQDRVARASMKSLDAASRARMEGYLADPATRPRVLEHLAGQLRKFSSDKNKGVGGCYRPATKKVMLDGGVKDGSTGPERYRADAKGSAASRTGLYAHELMHAIDGPEMVLSKSPQWKRVFEKEFGGSRLTTYASSEPSEAFAEFGRAIYAGHVDRKDIERDFPRAVDFFRDNGLWPED